jgi:hypothetical protein
VTGKPPFRFALSAALFALLVVLAPAATAAPPGHGSGGGGGGKTCTRNAPLIAVDNTWQWGMSGSWGMPGQQLAYSIKVINYDSGCSASSFAIDVAAPAGFAVSIPTNTINLKPASVGYLTAYVTSPGGAADGDYPLSVTLRRSGESSVAASTTSVYKVYSTDTAAPTLYWPNPGDGTTISGRSYNFAVSSNDDHAVRRIELYIDNAYVSAATCTNISYNCQLNVTVPLGGRGPHSATFRSSDWMGNVGVLTVAYTFA